MKLRIQCYIAYWGRRRKFCSNACQLMYPKAYQQAYQKAYRRAKQIRPRESSQRTRLRRVLKKHGGVS